MVACLAQLVHKPIVLGLARVWTFIMLSTLDYKLFVLIFLNTFIIYVYEEPK